MARDAYTNTLKRANINPLKIVKIWIIATQEQPKCIAWICLIKIPWMMQMIRFYNHNLGIEYLFVRELTVHLFKNIKIMSATKTKKKTISQARFDARLPRSQKDLFERAARIKGFKSLSEFVINTTQEAAIVIIERHNSVLVSEKDKDLFFEALVNPPKPNKALIQASKSYLKQVAAK